MISDTVLTIGKTHVICEDYVTEGDTPVPYLILCDGCSSSVNTDVGARLLAHSMRYVIEDAYNTSSSHPWPYLEMKQLAIKRAEQAVAGLGLNWNCLDATLITAVCIGGKVYVYMYGDGVILYREKSDPDKIKHFQVDFYNNMPYYASYLLSDSRRRDYQDKVEKGCVGMAIVLESETKRDFLRWDSELIFEFDLDEVSMVAISSDGISQVIDSKTGERLSLDSVAKEFLTFRTSKGEVLKRRLKKALEAYNKEKIYPTDDISIGVFLNEPD